MPGAIAAIVSGMIILFCGGWILAIPMLVFFISGSLLSKLPANRVAMEEKAKKPRDHFQVICNGGVGCICILLFFFTSDQHFIIAYFVSIAISNSDTWSSEWGNYFQGKTFDVISYNPMQKGLSGGVSLQGTLFGILGAFAIALIYFLLYNATFTSLVFITLAGTSGMITDSIIGSLWQGKYSFQDTITEVRPAGHPQKTFKGFEWMTNDLVNLLSNLIITIFFLLLYK